MPRTRVLLAVGSIWGIMAMVGPGRAQPTWDAGTAGAWHKLRKLQTTASVLHTTAHPDDEHGAVLAMLSRGRGARVSLATLTRGESGDNAIGSELFDALGLIRTEELRLSNRYYAVDEQYFGTVVDYGFSKRLEEALEKWGKEHALGDLVRIIRIERPFVVISRFQGTARDGHGNHAAAGLLTREAFDLAGDPNSFPEQIAEGLRPWQPLKLYVGGVRADEDWTIRAEVGEHDPVLGQSYQTLARLGLGFQRSQNAGRVWPQPGSSVSYYSRIGSVVDGWPRERSFFEGIDTSISGIYRALGKISPPGAEPLLGDIEVAIQSAVDSFELSEPSAAAAPLARALAAVRSASAALGDDADVRLILARKERQISEAIDTVLGIHFSAVAQPAGTSQDPGPRAAPAAMAPVTPGQVFQVRTTFVNPSPLGLALAHLGLESTGGWPIDGSASAIQVSRNQPTTRTFAVSVPDGAALSRPYFYRTSIQDARYTIADRTYLHRPAADGPLHAVARYQIAGIPVEIRRPVTRLEANLPYGYETRELAVVPALAVTLRPSHVILPVQRETSGSARVPHGIQVTVEVLHNREVPSAGTLRLDLPNGWSAKPSTLPLHFSRAGERAVHTFEVRIPALDSREYRITAVASAEGRQYREGYQELRHRDLQTRYFYRDAVARVHGFDVRIRPGLKVGYVMGLGDEVPAALSQLGAEVSLLTESDLATGDLDRFDSIIIGTRAYAVREDLKTHNRRLLEYVRNGGNLIVLYNTQELVPALYAPYPGELPANAEEVSEEDSPVDILTPDAAVLNSPNRLTRADFDNWMEQRGSKFWSAWDPRYTAIIATWDKDQAPQQGGWLHARHGKGHYTYFAYALHRQLPYGVSGAYRLLANLLSLNNPE